MSGWVGRHTATHERTAGRENSGAGAYPHDYGGEREVATSESFTMASSFAGEADNSKATMRYCGVLASTLLWGPS